jgi:raffinose/stachyose/melibiose transport system permease protein
MGYMKFLLGQKTKRRESLAPNYIILILLVAFAAGPLLMIAFNSVKSSSELGQNPLGIPHQVVWQNYPDAWKVGNFSQTMRNSVILVAISVTGVLTLGGMAAYSMAKLKMPGSSFFAIYLLTVSSLPLQMFLVPLFFMWNKLHLVNTLVGVGIIYIALNAPFAIFLLRSYIVQIPADFDDAARVDGASEWQVFTKIVVPLAWPAFLTTGLVVALDAWNEFTIATVFLTKPELFTIVTSYQNFATRFSRNWGLTSAGAVMMIAPLLIIFLLLQRQFIAGLTQGGLKG